MMIRVSTELAGTLRDLASELMEIDWPEDSSLAVGTAIGTLRTAAAGIDDLTAALDPPEIERPEGEPSYDQRIAALVLGAYRQGFQDAYRDPTEDGEDAPEPQVHATIHPMVPGDLQAFLKAFTASAAQRFGSTRPPTDSACAEHSHDFPGRAGG